MAVWNFLGFVILCAEVVVAFIRGSLSWLIELNERLRIEFSAMAGSYR